MKYVSGRLRKLELGLSSHSETKQTLNVIGNVDITGIASASAFADFDYQYVAKKVAPTFKIPNGELYTRLESGKGEIGVFIQGNNDVTPWRFKIRAADLNNLQILPHILKGTKVADIMAILGSIDVIMGSVDR